MCVFMAVKAASGIVLTEGLKDGLVLGIDDLQVAGHGVEVVQVFPDAEVQQVVKGAHNMHLGQVLGGVGDGHVKGDVFLDPQPAADGARPAYRPGIW